MFGIDDLAAASLVNTGVSTVGSFLGNIFNNNSQSKLLDKQNSFTEYMWNLNNQYNSPEATYQRYVDAGLNPMFFMSGNGSVAQQVQSSAAPTPAGNFNETAKLLQEGLQNTFNKVFEQKIVELQETRLNQDIQESKARIGKLASETARINIDNEYAKEINEKTINQLSETIKKTSAETANVWSDTRLKQAQRKYQNAASNLAEQQALTEKMIRKYKIDNIVKDTMLKQSQINVNDKEANLIAEQITDFILSNGQKAANLDLNGLDLHIKKTTADGLDLELGLKNSDEWKETYKRMGTSSDELTQGYVNGILSTITNTAFMLFLTKGLKGGRNGEMRPFDPKTGKPYDMNTGYKGSYGPLP